MLKLFSLLVADVAQLVEPRIVIPVVAGSNPVIRPIFSRRKIEAETNCKYVSVISAAW